MAELVDAPDLGSGAARRGGSIPSSSTMKCYFGHIAERYGTPDSCGDIDFALVHNGKYMSLCTLHALGIYTTSWITKGAKVSSDPADVTLALMESVHDM